MSGVPSRIVIGHGTQMEANEMQGSIDKQAHMATDNEACILHSRPYLALVSDKGESSQQGPFNPSMLARAIDKAGEISVPHG